MKVSPRMIGERRWSWWDQEQKHSIAVNECSPWPSVVNAFNLADVDQVLQRTKPSVICTVYLYYPTNPDSSPHRSFIPRARISAFDPLCKVRSDKASIEIMSLFDGAIKTLLVQEGEIAKVVGGLCVIEVESEDAAAEDAGTVTPPTAAVHDSSLQAGSGPEITTPSAPQATRNLSPLDPSSPDPGKSLGTQPKRSGSANPSIVRSKDLLSAPLDTQAELILQ